MKTFLAYLALGYLLYHLFIDNSTPKQIYNRVTSQTYYIDGIPTRKAIPVYNY